MQEITREYGFFESLPKIEAKLENLFLIALKQNLEIVFLCIGTPKFFGDSFGPIVGDKLLGLGLPFWVFGNSKSFVDANNARSTQKVVSVVHPNSLLVVVDALSTKNKSNVGDVVLSNNYVGLNPKVCLFADLFLFGTTTFVGHQKLYAKLELVEQLATKVCNTVKKAFLRALRQHKFEFLQKCVFD